MKPTLYLCEACQQYKPQECFSSTNWCLTCKLTWWETRVQELEEHEQETKAAVMPKMQKTNRSEVISKNR